MTKRSSSSRTPIEHVEDEFDTMNRLIDPLEQAVERPTQYVLDIGRKAIRLQRSSWEGWATLKKSPKWDWLKPR
jgi:hypothetical protein